MVDVKKRRELRKFVEQLAGYRGRHTELVTVYIPAGYELFKIINHLKEEQGTASNIKDKRTNYEIDIFHKFLETSKPILGICGGEQLMNVASGGDLIQDINHSIKTKIEHEQPNPRDQVSHEVIIKKDSKLHTIINKESIQVNSAHHQSVDNLGKNFVSAAIAADGVIEAIEHTHHRWCLGLQWHPEFLITNDDMAIIKDFVDHAK